MADLRERIERTNIRLAELQAELAELAAELAAGAPGDDPIGSDLITIKEGARIARKSPATLWRWAQQHDLGRSKVANTIYLSRTRLAAFLQLPNEKNEKGNPPAREGCDSGSADAGLKIIPFKKGR